MKPIRAVFGAEETGKSLAFLIRGMTLAMTLAGVLAFSACGPKNEDTPRNCGGNTGKSCVGGLNSDLPPARVDCPVLPGYGYLDPTVAACHPQEIPQTRYCVPHRNSDGSLEFHEDTYFEHGGEEGGDVYARGGGCIHRSLRDVWGVQVTDPAMLLLCDDHGQNSVSREAVNPNDPNEAFQFNLHCHLNKFPVGDLDWDIQWVHEIKQGTLSHPLEIEVDWTKVDGMDYIKYQRGTIILKQLEDDWVGFTAGTEIHAKQTKADEAESGLREALDKLRKLKPNLSELPSQ